MTQRRRGFTFIEIMMVMVIVMLLLAISLPRLQGSWQKARLKRAGRDIAGMLRYARNAAVLRELPCEVRFDPEESLYQFVMLDEFQQPIEQKRRRRRRRPEDKIDFSVGGDVAGVRRLDDVYISAIYTAAPLTEDTERPRIIYYADGSATPATIVLQDSKDRAINVEVYRTTGMARVELGVPEKEPKARTLYYGPKKK